MPELSVWVAGAMLVGLTFYALSGGADFGGGVWDLLASGPRAGEQRRLIAEAIAPIWEANHVWLVAAVVILFTAFPAAFAAITTALHIPLFILLLGIVLRGCAFSFRSFTRPEDRAYRRWSRVFAVASVLSPLMLGVVIGALASGRLRAEGGGPPTDFLSPWLAPFPLAVGLLALALLAFLAACYLTVEAREAALRDDFRLRAALSAAAVIGAAVLCLYLARHETPELYAGLARWPSRLLLMLGAALMTATLAALIRGRFRRVRGLAGALTAVVLWGWGVAQFPLLIVPDYGIIGSAAPDSVLRPLLAALGAGGLILFPAMGYLYKVFKGRL